MNETKQGFITSKYSLNTFSWGVEADGHEWRDDILSAGEEKPPFLVAKCLIPFLTEGKNRLEKNEQPRFYSPFDLDFPLYRTFADLSGELSEILAFVNQYGMLGIGREPCVKINDKLAPFIGPLHTEPSERDLSWSTIWALCESGRQWQEEIDKMQFLLALWEHLEDEPYLRKRIFWDDDFGAYFINASDDFLDAQRNSLQYLKRNEKHLIERYIKWPSKFWPTAGHFNLYLIADNNLQHPQFFRRWKKTGFYHYKQAARILFCDLINNELAEHNLRPMLQLTAGKRGDWDEIVCHLTPQTLLGAMYVQFHLEATGVKFPKRCKYERCNRAKYFYPTATRGRGQDYCSEPCRKSAHYHRRKNQKGR